MNALKGVFQDSRVYQITIHLHGSDSGYDIAVEVQGTAEASREFERIKTLMKTGSQLQEYYYENEGVIVKVRDIAAVTVDEIA